MPARLILIGDGPDRSMAERLARDGGFEDRAVFLGNVAAVETILPAAHLLLLPSEYESFGLAALEAMACGVPVIGASGGGLPEVVEDGVHGALRPVGDVGAMAQASIEILTDDALARRMAKACRERVEREYRRDTIVKQYCDLYEATLSA